MKSKGVYTYKLKQLYTAFLYSVKLSGYRIEIHSDNGILAVEQKNYATKIVNTYIVYDLDAWLRIPLNNFKLKIFLFRVANIVKIMI